MARAKTFPVDVQMTAGDILSGSQLTDTYEPPPGAMVDPGTVGADVDIPQDEALTDVLTQIGEDNAEARVHVYKCPKDQPKEYLFHKPVTEFALDGLDSIRDQYGGGTYEIRVYVRGRSGVLARRIVTIGNPIKPLVTAQSGADVDRLAGTFSVALNNVTAQFSSAIEKLAAAMSANNKPVSMDEMLRTMLALRELNQPTLPPAPAPASDPMKMIRDTVDMIATLKGVVTPTEIPDSTGGMILEGIKAFAPAIADAVKQRNAVPQSQALPAPQPMPPQPQPQPQPTPQSLAPQNAEGTWDFSGSIDYLINCAQLNRDPSVYAVVLLDHIPDEYLAEFVEFIKNKNLFNELQLINPKVAPFNDWFAELREEMLSVLSESEQPETPLQPVAPSRIPETNAAHPAAPRAVIRNP